MAETEGATRRRDEVLSTLRAASEPMTISELAERLVVHQNTVRFHLRSLVADGRVAPVQTAPNRPGRPPGHYVAVRAMEPSGPRNYRLLAGILDEALSALPDVGARAVEAGRVWGTRLAESVDRDPQMPVDQMPVDQMRADQTPVEQDPVNRLVALLNDAGFAPQQSSGGRQQIELRHCPFLESAQSGSRVPCQAHLGLMRGALERWRAPYTVDRLEVFAEPDLCRAHLVATGAAA